MGSNYSLTSAQTEKIRALVYKYTGITLGDNKDVMIKNRMDKLIRGLGGDLNTDAIIARIERGELLEQFINSYTTNKTEFFRESFHFDDLKQRVLPELFASGVSPKIYCSASSTGEEPYSIAITCMAAKSECSARYANCDILATDIDTEVLRHASEGVYMFDPRHSTFPNWVQPSLYFKKRSIDNSDNFLIKAKDDIRKLLKFGEQNLMSDKYPFQNGQFDVVFCRNVLIYFSQKDQNGILSRLFAALKVGGTLYLGHSESPLALSPYVTRVGQNIFVKNEEAKHAHYQR